MQMHPVWGCVFANYQSCESTKKEPHRVKAKAKLEISAYFFVQRMDFIFPPSTRGCGNVNGLQPRACHFSREVNVVPERLCTNCSLRTSERTTVVYSSSKWPNRGLVACAPSLSEQDAPTRSDLGSAGRRASRQG